jgi:hypothetical protein
MFIVLDVLFLCFLHVAYVKFINVVNVNLLFTLYRKAHDA